MVKRTYDIGHGVVVTDDGHSLIATWTVGDRGGSSSIGVQRPLPPLPKEGDEAEIKYSVGRRYFYLPKFTTTIGFWLGTHAWPTQAACEAQQPAGIFGKSGYEFTRPSTGEKWCREKLDFAYWKIDSEPAVEKRAVDDMLIDYLHLVEVTFNEGAHRFDDAIAFTGRNLQWIAERIGAWVPPHEIPPVTLT